MKPSRFPIYCSSLGRTGVSMSSASDPKYVNTALSGKNNFEKDFQKSHVKTTLFQKVLLGVGSGVISITSPFRGDMIAVMGEVTGYQAWEYIHRKMMESSEGRMILEDKPRISSGAVNLEKLKNYPDGTLGKAYSNFLEKYGYTPDTRNAVQFVDDLELAYVAQRYREAHDLFHTLLNMPTNMLGEVTVKWVEAIQLKLPMCAAGALFGSVRLAPKFSRAYSTRTIVKMEPSVVEKLERNEMKYKNHPGVLHLPCQKLPPLIANNIRIVLQDLDKKELQKNAVTFFDQLWRRCLPVESLSKEKKRQQLYENLQNKFLENEGNPKSQEKLMSILEKRLKVELFNWKPVLYDKMKSYQYLISRAPMEYSVLKRVFNEIATRDKNFAPKSLLDFGSGVGTVTWAAHDYWGSTIRDYYCIDKSDNMNNLAAKILRENDLLNPSIIENVYFRKFLPKNVKFFDLVVSSFSFMELPSCEQRLKVLTSLLNNTKNYLVLIENGTKAGFSIINEARDYIRLSFEKFNVEYYFFAPCPHEKPCPRVTAPGKKYPCVFYMNYENLRTFSVKNTDRVLFSFLIVKKGKKPPEEDRNTRFVREVLKKRKHAVCRLCTTKGELKQLTVTASKQGKAAFKCMKFSNWGDLVPGCLEEVEMIDSDRCKIQLESPTGADSDTVECEDSEFADVREFGDLEKSVDDNVINKSDDNEIDKK